VCDLETSRIGAPYIYDISSLRVKEAKKRHYDNQIKNSTNKNKRTWNKANKETHRKEHSTNIILLNIDGITTDNQQLIAEYLLCFSS
jgi:hypothetical protein